MKRNPKFVKNCNLLLILSLFSFLSCVYIYSNHSNDEIYVIDSPSSSSFDIEILTPENITYSEPMSGYYPSTYGFEDADNETLPSSCVYSVGGTTPDGPTSYAKVIGNKTDSAGIDHKKVLNLRDWTSDSLNSVKFNFSESGSEIARNSTIEFYTCIENDGGIFYSSNFGILGDNGNIAFFKWFKYGIGNPDIHYLDDSGEHDTGIDHIWDRWYRFSIDISCDGGYAGLSSNQFRFRIFDETETLLYTSIDLNMPNTYATSGPNQFIMTSSQSQSQINEYMDAFGITNLTDNYNVGDNIDEGLLLSFSSQILFDEIAYSLDGQSNITILGNKTIPMPENGSHSIQVFGNETSISYYSGLKNFTVDVQFPQILINYPNSDDIFGHIAPNFNIGLLPGTLSEHTVWYTLDGGITNFTVIDLIIDINQTEWDKIGNGSTIIAFYVNDTSGNINHFELKILKDIIEPQLYINIPNSNDLFTNSPPSYDISVVEANLDATWYSLDDGITKIPFYGLDGTIDTAEWNKIGNGTVTIKFFANDSCGNENLTYVTVRKETTVTINSPPTDFQYAEETAGYNVTWIATSFFPSDYIIYKNGEHNISGLWESNVPIMVNVDGLLKGLYNFTVYFYDSYGNYISDEVLITVNDETPPIINSPLDLEYYQETRTYSIEWIGSDNYPSTYTILLDGDFYDSGTWTADVICNLPDHEDVGTYIYTIEIFDQSGNKATDQVSVIIRDGKIPDIDSPLDIVYNEGDTGYTITWRPTDTSPKNYVIYCNDVVVESDDWDAYGQSFSIDIDGLVKGVYNYTIVVFDQVGFSTDDSVKVTILDDNHPIITPVEDINFTIGASGNFINWTAYDNYPSKYYIYQGSIPISSGTWSSGTPTIVNLDLLSAATYNFTIIIFDESGNSVSDEVLVTISPILGEPIELMDLFLNMALIIGSVGIFGGLGLYSIKKRRKNATREIPDNVDGIEGKEGTKSSDSTKSEQNKDPKVEVQENEANHSSDSTKSDQIIDHKDEIQENEANHSSDLTESKRDKEPSDKDKKI